MTETIAGSRDFYSVSEVAGMLGVSRVSVWRWVSAGRLPVARLGHRTVRIRRDDVDRIVRPFRGGRAQPAPEPALPFQAGQAEHLVLFYEAEPFLIDSVAEFIAPALKAEHRCALVATPRHRAAIDERLQAAGVDVRAARLRGMFVAKDAARTLSRVMVAGEPDAARFEQVVRELTSGGSLGGEVRIFGEMVALLVAEGKAEAALMLEELWNRAQQRFSFSILCAYPMHDFRGHARAQLLVDASTSTRR